ncbi:hypothetical protein RFI_27767 [Reticulomyxa filosa]|uniref:Conserved oligomeric Golgi complex subunit 7 n=1 Tax=Reticulomyxa filosa TaxID=46433 RepID=X6M7G7_RETFI|nr:hypothetical protein RFI_27767 [Reticulomyxa filosa]|eukprot:ETO09606.1 hypothetical protein RFI_27767 [Reticulomyxa filosa]
MLNKFESPQNAGMALFPKTLTALGMTDRMEDPTKMQNVKGMGTGAAALSSPPSALKQKMEAIISNIVMQEIHENIRNVHRLKVWTEKDLKHAKTLNLPQFNLQPSEYIRNIGSHVLTLVDHLESAIQNSGFEKMLLHQENEQQSELEKGKNETTETLTQLEVEKHKEENIHHNATRNEIDKWLNLVVNKTVHELFVELYQLNELSPKGNKQLIEDLNHLRGMAETLCVQEPEFIHAILKVLTCEVSNAQIIKEELLRDDNQSIDKDGSNYGKESRLRTSFEKKIATKFAILRGLNVRFV